MRKKNEKEKARFENEWTSNVKQYIYAIQDRERKSTCTKRKHTANNKRIIIVLKTKEKKNHSNNNSGLRAWEYVYI